MIRYLTRVKISFIMKLDVAINVNNHLTQKISSSNGQQLKNLASLKLINIVNAIENSMRINL